MTKLFSPGNGERGALLLILGVAGALMVLGVPANGCSGLSDSSSQSAVAGGTGSGSARAPDIGTGTGTGSGTAPAKDGGTTGCTTARCCVCRYMNIIPPFFRGECDTWLADPGQASCSIKLALSVELGMDQWLAHPTDSELIYKYGCCAFDSVYSGDYDWPFCSTYLTNVSVCVKDNPTCYSFTFTNLGCSTFQNYMRLNPQLQAIVDRLGGLQKVTISGNQCVAATPDTDGTCASTVTFTLTPGQIVTTLPVCNWCQDCSGETNEPPANCKDPLFPYLNITEQKKCCGNPPTWVSPINGKCPPKPANQCGDLLGQPCQVDGALKLCFEGHRPSAVKCSLSLHWGRWSLTGEKRPKNWCADYVRNDSSIPSGTQVSSCRSCCDHVFICYQPGAYFDCSFECDKLAPPE